MANDSSANREHPSRSDEPVLVGSSPPPPKLRLTRPHLLIQKTRHPSDLARDPDAYRRGPEGAQINVSKPQFRTALAVMDRFFKALEQRGLRVERVSDYSASGSFAVDGRDRVQVSLDEERNRVPHTASEKELKEKERDHWRKIPKWDEVPTGKLVLQPGGVVDLTSEGALTTFIEKAVADVIDRLATARKDREAREERQRREWAKEQAIREEKLRVEAFHKAAAAFHQYQLMMEYIEEVRRFGRVPDDQRREGQSVDEWLRWAEWQARQTHPLGYLTHRGGL